MLQFMIYFISPGDDFDIEDIERCGMKMDQVLMSFANSFLLLKLICH